MVLTPWGESSSLRGRKLRPGPSGAPGKVRRNQRERIYGAMVAVVAEKGYEATTVGDLVEVSGVSSRTFYDLFADKRACFVAAIEAMVEGGVAAAAAVSNDEALGGWEERARAGSRAFAEMIVAQRAAARMVLIDVYAAGPEAMAPLERAMARFEWLTRHVLEGSPERARMPAEMVSAYVGALAEVIRMRFLAGREAELPDLMDELWDLIASYRPPPQPLRLTTRLPAGRREGSESLEAHDHAERALRALAVVVAEKGYAAATVEDVLKRGRMSATTFYANFRGKEDALMAAIDSAGAQLAAAIGPAVRRAETWPAAVRAGFGALFNFWASRPALARLVTVEAYAAGPEAIERRVEHLWPLEELIAGAGRQGTGGGKEARSAAVAEAPAAIAVELLAGLVYALAYRRVREAGPRALPGLAPLCTYLALAPSLGSDEACAVACGEGNRR